MCSASRRYHQYQLGGCLNRLMVQEEAMAEEAKKAKGSVRPKEPAKASDVEVKKGEVAEAPSGRRPLVPFLDFDKEFERAFENFFNRGWLRASRWEFPKLQGGFGEKMPNVNVIDRDGEVVVEAELPGVDKDDLDVSLSENTVTIKASTRKEEEKEEGEYHRREISAGFFSRTLPLPAPVQGDKVKAEFKNGLLKVTLPKAEEAKRHSIKVD
jgi:HSP20 family protein